MTSFRETLKKGSFRNVPFYWESSSGSGGRKTVLFDFPNSDTRLSQDLGQIPDKFSLNVYTVGTGSDYYANRDALRDALNKAGAGELVHPTIGLLNVAITEPYTFDESLQELGKCHFSISFAVVVKDEFLPQAKNNVGIINQNLKNNLVYASYALDNNLNITNSMSQAALNSNISSIQSLFGGATSLIQNPTDAQAFSSILLNYGNYNIAGSSLGTNTTSLFSNVANSVQDGAARFKLFKGMFNYGDDTVASINPTTKVASEQLANQKVINQAVQSNALYHAVDAMTEKTYLTNTELTDDSTVVNAQINKLASNFSSQADVYNNLMETKSNFNQYVNTQSTSTYRITQVEVKNMGLTELCYAYYGNLDNYDLILNLNNIQNPSLLNGTYNIVTSA